jgi:cytochrome c2
MDHVGVADHKERADLIVYVKQASDSRECKQ